MEISIEIRQNKRKNKKEKEGCCFYKFVILKIKSQIHLNYIFKYIHLDVYGLTSLTGKLSRHESKSI